MNQDTIDSLIADGLNIIKEDITRLAKQTKQQPLTHSEVDSLNTHIRLLLAMKKEIRDAHLEADLEKLNKQDLDTLAKQAIEHLKRENLINDQ